LATFYFRCARRARHADATHSGSAARFNNLAIGLMSAGTAPKPDHAQDAMRLYQQARHINKHATSMETYTPPTWHRPTPRRRSPAEEIDNGADDPTSGTTG
jgi:hypothetical protein